MPVLNHNRGSRPALSRRDSRVRLFGAGTSQTSRGWFSYQVFSIFLALFLVTSWTGPVAAASAQDYESLRLITEALNEISQKYVWKKGEEEIIYGSLRGLMNSLDPDSSFLTPKEYQQILSGQKEPLAEAGVDLVYKDTLLTVVAAMEGGPAWRAGLRPGDHILKIDGHLVRNLTTQEANRRFQGKAGTALNLQVLRTGLIKPLELKVTLEPLAPGGVTHKILKESYAYIRMPGFTPETVAELGKTLKLLQRHHPPLKGFVLDLRNNARGSIDLAVRGASLFIGDKEVLSARGRPPEPSQVFQGRARSEIFKPGAPLVVLVDGGTARAAEALAGALRDQYQAVLLGSKTVGLCGLTKTLPLQDGSAIVMTVAQCYTPSGQKIHGKGLEPEVAGKTPTVTTPGVTPPAKLSPEQDPWVNQALEVLKTGKPRKVAEEVKKP